MDMVFECGVTVFVYVFFSAAFVYIYLEGRYPFHGIYRCYSTRLLTVK